MIEEQGNKYEDIEQYRVTPFQLFVDLVLQLGILPSKSQLKNSNSKTLIIKDIEQGTRYTQHLHMMVKLAFDKISYH